MSALRDPRTFLPVLENTEETVLAKSVEPLTPSKLADAAAKEALSRLSVALVSVRWRACVLGAGATPRGGSIVGEGAPCAAVRERDNDGDNCDEEACVELRGAASVYNGEGPNRFWIVYGEIASVGAVAAMTAFLRAAIVALLSPT